jgi:eukaryotic-like serine/threonine-protein kinase
MSSDATGGIGVGTVIADSYEVTGLLGRGGMGAVWVAQHRRLPGKRVAIKVLLAGAGDPQSMVRFQREAEIASRIGHPNIVDVLDFNQLADGTPYQVLEFLDGESLGARLKRGRLSLATALELARQMGSALLAAHRAGVVHRDLKPENIILCPTDAGGVLHDRVKILDFGISKIRGAHTFQTQESVLIGTPQYMSPEQAKGKNQEVDQRTDVFALGAIVYEMLSGRTAFSGDSVVSVILDVVQGTPAPLAALVPSLPAPVGRAVERALAKDANERFQDVGAFIHALTGRPLDTLGHTPAPVAVANPSPPLSAEEVMGATQASSPGPVSEGPPPITITATTDRTADPSGKSPARAPEPRRWPLFVGLGAALLVAGGGLLFARRPAPAVAPPQPVPAVAPKTTGAAAAKQPPAAPHTAASIDAARPAQAGPAPGSETDEAPADQRGPRASGSGVAEPPLPPEAQEHLAEAERLLDRGEAREAVRRARQSFFVRKSNRGWGLLTRAFCRQGDLENARASLRNLRQGSPERARALRACRAADIDLR